MIIKRLRITIEPTRELYPISQLRVEILTDGLRYETTESFDVDDFESRFDYMIEVSRREILRLVNQERPELTPASDDPHKPREVGRNHDA